MKSFKRACSDTFNGQLVALFVLVLGGGLSLAFLYVTESATVAVEEVPYVAGALFGAFGALLLLFCWNLSCAPYRIQRDRAEVAEDLLAKHRPDKSREQLAMLIQDGEKIKSACAHGLSDDETVNGWAAKVSDHIKVHIGSTEAAQFASDAGTSTSVVTGSDGKVNERWRFMNRRLEKLDRIASDSR